MIKNYLKIAYKVLLRRKLFTFISLFGISFTIMILVIVQAEVDSISSNMPPEINLNRTLFLKRLTVWTETSVSTGSLSEYFITRYVKTLQTPSKVSMYSAGNTDNILFKGTKRIILRTKSTDESFWEILSFEFLQGKPYLKKDVENANPVAVISESTSLELFGNENPLGKSIKVGENIFRVNGVVKDVPKNRMPFADVWIPYSADNNFVKHRTSQGGFEVMLMMENDDEFPDARNEFYSMLRMVQFPDMAFERITCPVRSHDEWLAGGKILGVQLYKENLMIDEEPIFSFNNTIILFMTLFILLPVLNLININTTRIFERSGEIGVRKSFGASIRTLTIQFIIENMLLSFLGGILGLLFAVISVNLLNRSSFFDGTLRVNLNIIFIGITISLVIGFLSGILPAYRMAKLNPVNSLRGEM